MSKTIHVVGAVVVQSGIHFHRIVNPFAYTEVQPDIKFSIVPVGPLERSGHYDILVYNKWLAMSPEDIRWAKAAGIKTVVDVDDYWDLPPNHPNYNWFKLGNTPALTVEHIRMADVVTVTTQRLADEITRQGLNKNIVIIPNALPFDRDQYQVGDRARGRELSAHDKTRFMYLGGVTHKEDIDLLDGKFKRIGGDKYLKDNGEWLLCGYNPSYVKNQQGEQKQVKMPYDHMADSFRKCGLGSFRIYPSVDLEYYLNYYDSADVAIVPLVASKWNSFKSTLKIVEAACKHIPVICSRVAPYSDAMEFCNNQGIMWAEKQHEWLDYFRYCIKNPSFVQEQGERLYQWCKDEYDLVKVNQLRLQVFRSLC